LARDLKSAKADGTEQQRLIGRNFALIFEEPSNPDPLRIRGRRP